MPDSPRVVVRPSLLATLADREMWIAFLILVPIGGLGGAVLLGYLTKTFGPVGLAPTVVVCGAVVVAFVWYFGDAAGAGVIAVSELVVAGVVLVIDQFTEIGFPAPSSLETVVLGATVAGTAPILLPYVFERARRKYELYDDRIVRAGTLPTFEPSRVVETDHVEIAIRKGRTEWPLLRTGTYELVTTEGSNLEMDSVTDPETVEAILGDVIEEPERQRQRAEQKGYPFWMLWPEECATPASPVVGLDELERRLPDTAISDLDLDGLERAVDTDGFEGFDDVGEVEVGGGFDGDVDVGGHEAADGDSDFDAGGGGSDGSADFDAGGGDFGF